MINQEHKQLASIHSPQETSHRVIEECSHDDYVSQFLAPCHEDKPPQPQDEQYSS